MFCDALTGVRRPQWTRWGPRGNPQGPTRLDLARLALGLEPADFETGGSAISSIDLTDQMVGWNDLVEIKRI